MLRELQAVARLRLRSFAPNGVAQDVDLKIGYCAGSRIAISRRKALPRWLC